MEQEQPDERKSAPRQRLLKSDKLTLKADFEAVRLRGRTIAGALLVVAFIPADDEQLQAGVVCGKKYCLRAVGRNRARRLIWESFRQLKADILPARLVFIPRQRMKHAKCQEVMEEMRRLLSKLDLWNGIG